MKRLKQYANKRFKNLETHLASYQQTPDVEILHKIRVEIKKLKALLQLINYCARKFRAHKTFLPLRTIFRKAGEIRQPEVFYRLLLLYQIKGVRDESIPKAKYSDRLSKALVKQIPIHIKSVVAQEKIVEKYVEKVTMDCIKKYLKRRKKQLRSELYPKMRQDRLHKSRKTMKEIIYLSGIVKGGDKKLDKFYHHAEALVGQWHDRQMLTFELIRNKKTSEVKRLTTENEADIKHFKKIVSRYYQ